MRELSIDECHDVAGGVDWVKIIKEIAIAVLGNATYEAIKNGRIDPSALSAEQLRRLRESGEAVNPTTPAPSPDQPSPDCYLRIPGIFPDFQNGSNLN